MNTTLKIAGSHTRPSRTRIIILWTIVLAIIAAMAGLFLSALPDMEKPVTAQQDGASTALPNESAGNTCLRLLENPKDYLSGEAMARRAETALAACKQAFAAEPDNVHFKVAYARALPVSRRTESIALWREAAAQGDAEAYYELYEWHKSWERGDLDHVQLVTRAEADQALRKAAEFGHPFSTQMLAIRLDRGDIVKRDPAAARVWAERALANPAKDESRGSLAVLLGRLLTTSDKPEERARGIEILERMSKAGVFGAKTDLAVAIRAEDPVHARALLEESLRPDPGGATPVLAEMLIKGEGGPADPKRALKMLTGRKDMAAASGVLGQLYLEGKLVPRNVQEAARLIGMAGAWDLDARQQVVKLLAQNPGVRVEYPKRVLYDAAEAAELDEPGAMAALIDLKLSENPQFQDRPGACKLMETAAKLGDQAAAQRLPECRAN